MSTLRVQHLAADGPPRFQLVRPKDSKVTVPVEIASPVSFSVKGRPHSNLVRELRWYLEDFLAYPFSPETEHADRVLEALKKWGRQAFDTLFNDRQAAKFLYDAQDGGRYDRLTLQIASDDPRVLGWPWEALEDSHAGLLAQTCRIERRLNQVADPAPLQRRLPRDRVNILLVTARPYARDVRYRSISRLLVELIEKDKLPAHVTVLRPPTLEQLRRHLGEHPHTYHVLHFDGHGGYGEGAAHQHASGHCFQAEGVLLFETADGEPDPVAGAQLSNLLREHAVPAVVLNACQSAMIDERAPDPFASVAAALLKSGMRSVVAMAYSLYVSGARRFVPAFYERLFRTGDVAEAVRAGRQQMFANPGRICARGEFPLQDWLVPVVYQQDPLDFSFAGRSKRGAKESSPPRESKLPTEARDTENPHGFIGRDGPLLELERALLRPPAAILIQGLGGVGKTTLARGFVEWLELTGGLGTGCLWFDFREIRSAEFVVNRTGEALFGGQFAAQNRGDPLGALAAALRDNRVIIVWDNFEVARGISGTSVTPNLTEDDCALLHRLLKTLRGGQTKVLITSRSPEEWLGHEHCFLLPIGGLDGDERWEYCEVVLRDLGLSPQRDDPNMIELMELLAGHPLAMRAILPKLAERPAAALVAALRNNLDGLDLPEDEVSAKLAAVLRFVEDSLPAEQRALLVALSLHAGFVDADFLEDMARQADERLTRPVIDRFTGALAIAGLLRDRGQSVFELHPALTGYLHARVARNVAAQVSDAWARAFVELMAGLADELAPRELHEQRPTFHVHGANFHHALVEAERLGMDLQVRALLRSLAEFARHMRDFADAGRLFTRLAETSRAAEDLRSEASALHELGIIAQEQRDLPTAEQWYRKSLAIKEKLGDEQGAARTYHQVGTIAEERRDFAAAERWYRKSLAIKERLGDEHGVAMTYHALASIAQERRDFGAAEQWYRKSVAVKERLGDEHGAASTYHNLGMIAEEQRDFAAAEQWYGKSLVIAQRLEDDQGAALTYHQLGIIAYKQRDFDIAEQWYHKSLAITERLKDEQGTARTYHQLGIIAHERRDFAIAEQWYHKSLAIAERLKDEHGAAITYHQLGMIAEEQRDFAAAEQWYRKSLAIAERLEDDQGAALTYHQLGIIAHERCDFAAAEQWYRKSLAIKEKVADEHGAAITYHQLGRIAQERRDLAGAEQWYRKSLVITERVHDEHCAANTYHQLGIVAQEQGDLTSAEQWYRTSLAVKENLSDEYASASTYGQLGVLAGLRGQFEESARWLIRSVQIYALYKDPRRAAQSAGNFMVAYRRAPADLRPSLAAMWRDAGLGELPEK